jgi:branched-chain amino acid transport system permease protein
VDAFLTSRPIGDLLSGIVGGTVIGLVALSLVLIWRATHILNFAQGAMAMFATYIGMTRLQHRLTVNVIGIHFTVHFNYWWCVAISILAGLAIGGITERVLVRPLYGKPEINPIVVMVGYLALLEALAGAIWGTIPITIQTPFSFIDWQLGGKTVLLSPNDVYRVVATLVVAIVIALLFRFTNLGLQLRASAVAPEVSRLLGVRVGRMLTIGWILASGVGAVAAVILTSSSFQQPLQPPVMEAPFAIAFIAAAIGGLESPTGALVAGIAFGVMEQFVTDYLNSNYVLLIALGALILVLMIRPQGLFSKRVVRRV